MYLEEKNQSLHLDRKLEKLEIQLIDIEESLRFGHRTTSYVKQNFSKCIKVFYQVQEFFTHNQIQHLYKTIRKIFECLGIAFSKLFLSIQTLQKQNFKLNRQSLKKEVEQTDLKKDIDKKTSQIKKLGGVILTHQGNQQRGMQQQVEKQSEVKGIQMPHHPSEISRLRKQIDDQTMIMNKINAVLNKNADNENPQSSIQLKLMQILQYFNECQKQALAFLNQRLWDINFENELSYKQLIDEFEKKKGIKKDEAQKKINSIFEKNNNKILEQKQKFIIHQKSILQKQKQKLKKIFLKEVCNQSVQTYQVSENHVLQQYIQEKTLQYESQKKKNQSLIIQLHQFKSNFQIQKKQIVKAHKTAESFRNEIQLLNKQIQPMKQYLKSINREYSQLYAKFKLIWEADIDEMVKNHSEQYSTQMRLSLATTLKKILDKLGISNSDQFSKKKHPRFHFRLQNIKNLQYQDFQQSFLEELLNERRSSKNQNKNESRLFMSRQLFKGQSYISKSIKSIRNQNQSKQSSKSISQQSQSQYKRTHTKTPKLTKIKLSKIDKVKRQSNFQSPQYQNKLESSEQFSELQLSCINENTNFQKNQESNHYNRKNLPKKFTQKPMQKKYYDNTINKKKIERNDDKKKTTNITNITKKKSTYFHKAIQQKNELNKANNTIKDKIILQQPKQNKMLISIGTQTQQINNVKIYRKIEKQLSKNVRLSLQNVKKQQHKRINTQTNVELKNDENLWKNTNYLQKKNHQQINSNNTESRQIIKNIKNLNQQFQKFHHHIYKANKTELSLETAKQIKYNFSKTTLDRYWKNQKRISKEKPIENLTLKMEQKIIFKKNKQIDRIINCIKDDNALIQQIHQLIKTTPSQYFSKLIKKSQIPNIIQKIQITHLQQCKSTFCIHLQRFLLNLKKIQQKINSKQKGMRIRLQVINKIQTQKND